VLADPRRALEEKAGADRWLAQQIDNDAVFMQSKNCTPIPASRAKGLKAMVRSFDAVLLATRLST